MCTPLLHADELNSRTSKFASSHSESSRGVGSYVEQPVFSVLSLESVAMTSNPGSLDSNVLVKASNFCVTCCARLRTSNPATKTCNLGALASNLLVVTSNVAVFSLLFVALSPR